MTTQIAIIGLGRTGTSIGLALKQQTKVPLTLIGHDREHEQAKKAQKLGALDRAEWNLPKACETADVVVLAVPLSALHTVLTDIAHHLKAGCVVTDTAPLKVPVLKWAAQTLPEGRYFVGGFPVLNPVYLMHPSDSPQADLFERGLWVVASGGNTPLEALKLVSDLATLIGSSPFFVGADEHDVLFARAGTLPALAATAVMNVAENSAGWADASKLADYNFALATAPVAASNAAALAASATLNRKEVSRFLGDLIAELQSMRAAIAADSDDSDQMLAASFAGAATARQAWLAQRQRGDWQQSNPTTPDIQSVGSQLKRMFVGSWGDKK